MTRMASIRTETVDNRSAVPRRIGGLENNRLRPEDSAAHDWYRFVLSFPPHLVRDYLERFGIARDQVVLDPFCGTGTTLVECKKHGIRSIGVEPNPMAHFASQTKVSWDLDPGGLLDHAESIARRVSERLRDEHLDAVDLPLFSDERPLAQNLQRLPAARENLVLQSSISPIPLHKTLTLLDEIDGDTDQPFGGQERLALAKALISGIGNLKFGPEVGIGPAKVDAPVVELWLGGVRAIAADLQRLRQVRDVPSTVYRGDARLVGKLLEPDCVDAVITSPPYPNEKDYTRTTRLESVILGFISSKDDLRAIKRNLVRSNTRSVYKTDDDDQLVSGNPEIQRIAEAIERRRIDLGKTSGFERLYARVTKLYFGGMARHLAALRTVLRPGARLAYVVGDQASYLKVMIKTGELLASMAESLGYEIEGIDLFRTRLATATREQLREEVVILRWHGGDP